MRLIRFGEKGYEKPGLLNQDRIVDLTRLFPGIPDIDQVFFEDGWFEKAAAVDAVGISSPPAHRPEWAFSGIRPSSSNREMS